MGLQAWVGWLYKHIAWADTLTIHHLSLRLNYLLTKGLSYGLLWKMGMGVGQENYCLWYSYMHSEKSSLVLIVVLLRLVYA